VCANVAHGRRKLLPASLDRWQLWLRPKPFIHATLSARLITFDATFQHEDNAKIIRELD
jgi:hypothetical protein